MPQAPPLSLVRVVLPVVVVANVAFNYLSDPLAARLGFRLGPSVRAVSDRYDHLFTPAPFAFSIWGVIYAAFLAYSVVQLRAVHRANPVYDRLSAMLIVANLLAAGWIVAFRAQRIDLSVGIIGASLLVGIGMFVTAHRAKTTHGLSTWITVPFSLYLGWISVATIANVSTFFVSAGFQGGMYGTAPFAVGMIAGAALLATVLAVGFRDYLVPAVVAWTSFALLVKYHLINPSVGAAALIAAILMAFLSIAVVLWNLQLFSRWQARRDKIRLRAAMAPPLAPLSSSQDHPSLPNPPRESYVG